MSLNNWARLTVFFLILLGTSRGSLAQQSAGVSVPQGRALGDATGRPPLLFREEWKQPPYEGELDDEKRRIRVTGDAVGNPHLELTVYGTDASYLLVAVHEGRHDLWSGLVKAPFAATLRDKDNYLDLTGRARLMWITRTGSLHVIHPVIKLPDGTLLAGSLSTSTDGDFLASEVTFSKQRWFKLDPQKIVTTIEVNNPDLSRVEEIGYVDLMPGGGKGVAGWVNVSVIELYAKAIPRESISR